jgi:hypothetical protein
MKSSSRPIFYTFVKMFHILESPNNFESKTYFKLWAYMADIVVFAINEKIEQAHITVVEFTTAIGFKALIVDTSDPGFR